MKTTICIAFILLSAALALPLKADISTEVSGFYALDSFDPEHHQAAVSNEFNFNTQAAPSPEAVVREYTLNAAYPNPFNSTLRLSYTLPAASEVNIGLFDASGRRVGTLVEAAQPAGTHTAAWSCDDIASGVYYVRMEAGCFQTTQKVSLVK